MKYLASCALFLQPLISLIAGQVSVEGAFKPAAFGAMAKDIRLEPLDNAELLMKEDKAEPGYLFAFPRAVSIDMASECLWTVDSQKKSCKLKITSPGALSLSVLFNGFSLPEGAELYVAGQKVF